MPPLALALLLSARAAPEDDLAAARAAERAGDPVAEAAACEAVLAQVETGKAAEACRGRLAWLAAHRDADGTYTSLETLDTVRRTWREAPAEADRARVAALVEAPGTAPAVRDEAALWLGREALDGRGAAAEALPWTGPLWARLAPTPPSGRRSQAGDLHARALLASGDEAGARQVEAALAPVRSADPQEGLPLALKEARRGRLRLASWAGLGLFGLAAAPGAARTWVRAPRPRPWGLVPLALAGVGAGALAAAWDRSTLPAFAALLAAFAALHLLSAGALARRPGGPARLGLRLLSAVATLGAAFLVLDRYHLLAGLGL